MARPSKCSAEVTQIVCDKILAGNTDRVAAVAAGVSLHAMQDWMRRGAAGSGVYSGFYKAVTEAKAEIEERMVSAAYAPLNPDPESARVWLARRRRNDWGASNEADDGNEKTWRVRIIVPGTAEEDSGDSD